VLASLACRMHRLVDAGDHAILIAEVLDVNHREGRPLVYYGSGYHKLDGVNGG
jgi:flavin reductase (DIM6/NTAB) family NADH-FMN oxidoreductase RutF